MSDCIFEMRAPACDLMSAEELAEWWLDGNDLYDTATNTLLIGDVGYDEDDRPVLHGVMTAPFDPDDFAHEDMDAGDWEALRNPVAWALGSIPAPGALGAPNHMGWLSVDDAVLWVRDDPATIADPGRGVTVLWGERTVIREEG